MNAIGKVITQRFPPEPTPHRCSESTKLFSQSGPVNEIFDAASTIVMQMVKAPYDEIKSCPRPNGFTLFHFIPLAKSVDNKLKQKLFDRLLSNSEMSTLINRPTDTIDVNELYVEVDGIKLPLANCDRPAHLAILFGDVNDVERQLSAETGMCLLDCIPNGTNNNPLNLAAGRSLDIVKLVCKRFRQLLQQRPEYLTHQANGGATPLHHAGKSQHADKLKVFAKLLEAGASSCLSLHDSDNLTPLDHLSPDEKQLAELKALFENPALSDAIKVFQKKGQKMEQRMEKKMEQKMEQRMEQKMEKKLTKLVQFSHSTIFIP